MALTNRQLAYIQERVQTANKQMKEKDAGFGAIMAYADWTAWASHALLNGWSIDKDTGQLYQQKDNVRTYFKKI